jgi:hypothetical protein
MDSLWYIDYYVMDFVKAAFLIFLWCFIVKEVVVSVANWRKWK